jgi:hypothetical protein
MKHHYVVQAIMRHWTQEFLCPMGAVCTIEELNAILRHKGVKSFKIKSIDGEPVEGWENTEWIVA